MTDINFVLQGKGGVGKSMVSFILASYYQGKKIKPLCFDTDKGNSSFTECTGLNVEYLKILTDEKKLDKKLMDNFFEKIAKSQVPVVVDNGSSSWEEMSELLINDEIISYLISLGHHVYIHNIISGPERVATKTLMEVEETATVIPEGTRLVIWNNQYPTKPYINGKDFKETKTYKEIQSHVYRNVTLPNLDGQSCDFMGSNFQKLLDSNLTFDEALASEKTFNGLEKLRLLKIRSWIDEWLDPVLTSPIPETKK